MLYDSVISYADINSIFYDDKNILTQNNYAAINNSISNIIFTNKGEKVGDPEFGTNLRRLLFAPMDRITEHLMTDEIRDAISYYEPRVVLNHISLTPDYDNNYYGINILYTIVKSPEIQSKYVGILKRL
jgi:phage baseplate assembly protein W